jgi:hypothetical protein
VVQLNILTGKKAGTEWVARRFPFTVGRSSQDALSLDDEGVWDLHLKFDLLRHKGAVLEMASEAFVAVNGQRLEQPLVLRNGDVIELGAVKLRFGLSPTRQRSLRFREAVTWIALAALCLGQVALIYWLAD